MDVISSKVKYINCTYTWLSYHHCNDWIMMVVKCNVGNDALKVIVLYMIPDKFLSLVVSILYKGCLLSLYEAVVLQYEVVIKHVYQLR